MYFVSQGKALWKPNISDVVMSPLGVSCLHLLWLVAHMSLSYHFSSFLLLLGPSTITLLLQEQVWRRGVRVCTITVGDIDIGHRWQKDSLNLHSGGDYKTFIQHIKWEKPVLQNAAVELRDFLPERIMTSPVQKTHGVNVERGLWDDCFWKWT